MANTDFCRINKVKLIPLQRPNQLVIKQHKAPSHLAIAQQSGNSSPTLENKNSDTSTRGCVC
jgi:hypothetical protein